MSDLLDEIKDDIKQENYAILWQRYGRLVITILIMVIIGTAIGVWYKQYRITDRQQEVKDLHQGLVAAEQGDFKKSQEAYDNLLKEDEHSAIGGMVKLNKSFMLSKSGDIEGARKLLTEIAKDSSVEREVREYADLLDLQYLLTLKGQDKEVDDEAILARLNHLSADKGVWQYSAKELLAFYQWNQGRIDETKRIFESLLADSRTPPAIYQRGQQMLESLQPKEEVKK